MKKNIIIFAFVLSMFNSCTLLPFLSPEEKAESIQLLQEEKALNDKYKQIEKQFNDAAKLIQDKLEILRKDAEILEKKLFDKFAAEPHEKLWIDKGLSVVNEINLIGNAILKEMGIDFTFPVIKNIEDFKESNDLFRKKLNEFSKIREFQKRLLARLTQNQLKNAQEFERKYGELQSKIYDTDEMKALNNLSQQYTQQYTEERKKLNENLVTRDIFEKYEAVNKKIDTLFNDILAKYVDNSLVQEYKNALKKQSELNKKMDELWKAGNYQESLKLEDQEAILRGVALELKEKILRGEE